MTSSWYRDRSAPYAPSARATAATAADTQVIRATKELEWLLEEHFDAPGGKNVGLHDKISHARHEGQPLPAQMVRTMRKLVTIRNKLGEHSGPAPAPSRLAPHRNADARTAVHDRDFNAVPERKEFARSFDEVVAELQRMVKPSRGGKAQCTIC